jgi:uncharacterized protein (TIGR02421 family)
MDEESGSGRFGNSSRQLNDYEIRVRSLSDRLVRAQRPIRILDAVKWDHTVERAFFASGCHDLPPVTRAYYQARPLAFDPQQKTEEFKALESDIRRHIGAGDAPGRIMVRMSREYRDAVHMLTLRGTPAFCRWSAKLYGSTREVGDRSQESGVRSQEEAGGRRQEAGVTTGEGGRVRAPRNAPSANRPFLRLWAGAPQERPALEKTLNAQETVDALAERLQRYFKDSVKVRVRLSDGILADAAAGCGYIKIRGSARFTLQDVRLLEVHEGWVHLGTSLNGQSQPICTFLSKGSPTSTITQEGLAVLTEVATSASHPARMRRLTDRVQGIALAEQGADFCEVYRFFEEQGYEYRDSYHQTARIFRGSLPAGCGPFTKDLSYWKGFLNLCNWISKANSQDRARRLPLLFCGKTHLADLPALEELVEQGLVARPKFLPPPFAGVKAIRRWINQTTTSQVAMASPVA